MTPPAYDAESLETVFETAGIDYKTTEESPTDAAYNFMAWPSPAETAVEDFGRYLAVLDAFIDDTATRHHVYDALRTNGRRCYLPPGTATVDGTTSDSTFAVDADTVRDPSNPCEVDGMKHRALQEYDFDDTASEDVFRSAYEGTKEELR